MSPDWWIAIIAVAGNLLALGIWGGGIKATVTSIDKRVERIEDYFQLTPKEKK